MAKPSASVLHSSRLQATLSALKGCESQERRSTPCTCGGCRARSIGRISMLTADNTQLSHTVVPTRRLTR